MKNKTYQYAIVYEIIDNKRAYKTNNPLSSVVNQKWKRIVTSMFTSCLVDFVLWNKSFN